MTNPFNHFRDPEALPPSMGRPVVAIGNFDGIHLGHRALLAEAHRIAAASTERVAVLTFAPHPRQFFQTDAKLFQLTSPAMKERLLASADVDALVTLTFNGALAALSAEAFIRDILVQRLHASGIVIGHDFHFGYRRLGNPVVLEAAGKAYGFTTHVVQPQMLDGSIVSSSRIRSFLTNGEITAANRLLGREWSVESEVLHGDKRGRELGYPTANLHLDNNIQLKHGIYAVRAVIDGVSHDAVASFGSRPTFDDGRPKLEVHVFDYSGDLYGKTMAVSFVGYIREEQKFSNLDALVRQMDADSVRARAMLAD